MTADPTEEPTNGNKLTLEEPELRHAPLMVLNMWQFNWIRKYFNINQAFVIDKTSVLN